MSSGAGPGGGSSNTWQVWVDFNLRNQRFNRGLGGTNQITNNVTQNIINNINNINNASGGLGRNLFSMISGISDLMRMAGSAIDMLGFGLDGLKSGLIDANSRAEQLEIGIGGAMASMVRFTDAADQAENFAWSMQFAAGSMASLRRDAAASVGTTADFVEAFQMLIGPTARTGLAGTDLKLRSMAREMTGLAVAASNVLYAGDSKQGISDLSNMLQGTAGSEQKFARIFGITGDAAAKFNALDPSERFEKILDLLKRFEPAIAEFGDSWTGLTSTLEDTKEIFLAKVGFPMFEELKGLVSDVNVFLAENEEGVDRLAGVIGGDLRDGLKSVLGITGEYKTTWGDVENIVYSFRDGIYQAVTYGEMLNDTGSRINETFGLLDGAGSIIDAITSSFTALNSQLDNADSTLAQIMKALGMINEKFGPSTGWRNIAELLSYSENMQTQTDIKQQMDANYKASENLSSMMSYQYSKAISEGKNPESVIKGVLLDAYTNGALGLTDDDMLMGMAKFDTSMGGKLGKGMMQRLRDYNWGLINNWPDDESEKSETERNIRVMDEAAKKVKKGKVKKTAKVKAAKEVQIKQVFTGPVRIEMRLEDLEPDRVAVALRRDLAKIGGANVVTGLDALLNFGG